MFIRLMVLRCDAQDFLERRNAFERFFDSDHAQCFHSFVDCLIFDHDRGSAFDDQAPDGFAHRERSHDGAPPQIPAPFAAVASHPVKKDRASDSLPPELLANPGWAEFFAAIILRA